jgi:hypothetical protein
VSGSELNIRVKQKAVYLSEGIPYKPDVKQRHYFLEIKDQPKKQNIVNINLNGKGF